MVGVTSNQGSKLGAMCDLHIYLPLERELCPFDLAPVTSTAIQMIFGDTCAAAIMHAKTVTTTHHFHASHLTARLDRDSLTVKDLMMPVADLPVCDPDTKLIDFLPNMSSMGYGCVLVCRNDGLRLVGVFTDGDLRRKLASDGFPVLYQKLSSIAGRNYVVLSHHFTSQK